MAQRVVSGGSEERQGDTERLKKELKRQEVHLVDLKSNLRRL